MKLPCGVVEKCGRLFGRIHAKGGEHSFPLGIASDAGPALQRFYTIRALIRQGTDPATIKDALQGELGLSALVAPGKPETETEPSISVAAAAKRWLAEWVEPERKPKDAKCIRSRVEKWLLPFIGKTQLRSLQRADCFAYKGHVRAAKPNNKPGTLLHYLKDLRELLNWAVDVELLEANPWPQPRRSRKKASIMPRIPKAPPDRLTDEEVEILVALPDPWGFNLRLAIATALRWSELIRLKRTDLTPDGHLLVREAKDGEPREVPAPRWLVAEIMQRRGHLFVTKKGKPYSETSHGAFSATIRRMAAKRVTALPIEERKALAGLSRFHNHMTRHSYGCRYVEAGGELAMLQEIMGHASVVTTQRYARPNRKAIQADAQRVHAVQEANSR